MFFRLNNNILNNNFRKFYSTTTKPIYEFITYKPINKSNLIEKFKTIKNEKSFINIWETELGAKYQDEVICFFEFESLNDRNKFIDNLNSDPILKTIEKNSITLNEFPWAKFNKISNQSLNENKLWELRTYCTKEGKINQWESDFTKGFEVRKVLSSPVGVWNGDFENSKAVVHLWPYKNHEHRLSIRNAALKNPIWVETVVNTTKSLTSMESKVIKPIQL